MAKGSLVAWSFPIVMAPIEYLVRLPHAIASASLSALPVITIVIAFLIFRETIPPRSEPFAEPFTSVITVSKSRRIRAAIPEET